MTTRVPTAPETAKQKLLVCAPALLCLCLLQLILSVIVTLPVTSATSHLTTEDLLEPGGLMLLEAFRLNRSAIVDAVATSAVLLIPAHLALGIARCFLYAAVSRATFGDPADFCWLRALPAFLAVTIAQYGAGFFALSVFGGALQALPDFDGRLPPHLTMAFVALCLLTGATALGILVVGDLWKLALLRSPASPRELPIFGDRIRLALHAARDNAASLGLARVLRAICTSLLGAALVMILRASWTATLGGSLTAFLLTQVVVFAALCLELSWLLFAGARLQRFAASQP